MYCERCGNIRYFWFRRKCKNCRLKLKLLSEEMKRKYNIFDDNWLEIIKKLDEFSNLTLVGTFDEELNLRKELTFRIDNFVKNELSSNPLFSIEEYTKNIEERRKRDLRLTEYTHKQINDRMVKNLEIMQKEKDKANCIPQCPICGSTNIQKITVSTRVVKTAIFGVAGAVDDSGKTWQCENCSSKF